MLTQHTTTDTAAYRRNSSSTLDLPAIVYAPRPRRPEPARPPTPAKPPRRDLASFSFSPLPEPPRSTAHGDPAAPQHRQGTRLGLLALTAMMLLGTNHPTHR